MDGAPSTPSFSVIRAKISGSGGVAVRGGLDLHVAQLQPGGEGDSADALGRAHQDRPY